MQSFSKKEITWTAGEMFRISALMEKLSTNESTRNAECAMYRLRAEQYKKIAEKLTASVEKGDRRIAIRYT